LISRRKWTKLKATRGNQPRKTGNCLRKEGAPEQIQVLMIQTAPWV
jgi:hypothetical protein